MNRKRYIPPGDNPAQETSSTLAFLSVVFNSVITISLSPSASLCSICSLYSSTTVCCTSVAGFVVSKKSMYVILRPSFCVKRIFPGLT